MKLNRQSVSIGTAWLVLIVIVFAGYAMMARNHNRLRDAQAQLRECKKLAQDIQALQQQPGFAALGVDSPRTITTRAEHAGQQAKIPPTALARIEPQSAVRLRDSPYRLRPTRLEIRRVTLEQIVVFTHALIDEAQGTTVRDIRLTAAEGNAEGAKEVDLWTAEIVLTQLIYSPL